MPFPDRRNRDCCSFRILGPWPLLSPVVFERGVVKVWRRNRNRRQSCVHARRTVCTGRSNVSQACLRSGGQAGDNIRRTCFGAIGPVKNVRARSRSLCKPGWSSHTRPSSSAEAYILTKERVAVNTPFLAPTSRRSSISARPRVTAM